MFQIDGSGAQRMQEQGCGAVIEQVVDEQAHHLGQPDLDGVRVFEGGKGYAKVVADILAGVELLLHPQVVKVTMVFIAEGGRSALCAIDFNVMTATNTYWI